MNIFLFLLFFTQNDIETETLVIDSTRPEFENALRIFRSVEGQDSLQLFEKIIETLESRQKRNEDEALMLSESLKHLAILTFPDKTDYYFKRMIKLNPGCSIQAGTMSPKFIRIFNQLKSELTGSLLINVVEASDPSGRTLSGGRLLINGRVIGFIESGIPISVLSGVHEITIDIPNFNPLVQEINVVANGSQSINGILYRNAADLGFVTSPQGVRVFLNGTEMGITEGQAPAEYAKHLIAEGLTTAQASSVFLLNNIQKGTYDIRFQKPCFQTRTFTVDVEELNSKRHAPVIMLPSKAYISVKTVTTTPGIVYLDNERLGSLPLRQKEVCPGSYQLRVQFPDGQFVKKLVLEEDDHIELNARPQPSLAWFGIQELEGKAPSQPVDQWLHNLKTWNVIDVDSTDTALISHDPHSLLFNDGNNIDGKGKILTQAIKADLFVAARVVRKKTIILLLEIAFWSPLSPSIKTYSIDFRDLDRLKKVLVNIDEPLALLSPWLGIETIQLKGLSGLYIQTVHPDGPLSSVVQAGQIISAFNGGLANHPKNIKAVDFNTINLKVANQLIEAKPIPALIELPFTPDSLCPQAVIARLEKTGNYADDPLVRASATFNLARYYFFMKDYQHSFDLFTNIQLPNDYGISKGTLLFYQGLCYQRLNLKAEAAVSFNMAMNYPKATLFGPNGPKAKQWAETQLTTISGH